MLADGSTVGVAFWADTTRCLAIVLGALLNRLVFALRRVELDHDTFIQLASFLFSR